MDRFHMSDLLKAVRMPLDYDGTPLDILLYYACVDIFIYAHCVSGNCSLHSSMFDCLSDDKFGLLVGACSEIGLSEITMELLHLRPAPAASPSLRL